MKTALFLIAVERKENKKMSTEALPEKRLRIVLPEI